MKIFSPPPVDSTNIYEQILLEEEEIHNLAELDAKLEKICYKPAIWVKVIDGISTAFGAMAIGGIVGGTLGGINSAKASNLDAGCTFMHGLGGAAIGGMFSGGLIMLLKTIPGLIFNHIIKSCIKNVVNSNAPKDEKIKCIQKVMADTKNYYEKIKNKDTKSAEYVIKAIRELEDALMKIQKS